jgi:hypothetical protein
VVGYKDYRLEGPERYTTMTLEPGEFIRRFLLHVLPKGFHRIRHYGLLANGGTKRADISPALGSSSLRHLNSLRRPRTHLKPALARTRSFHKTSTIPVRIAPAAW